MNGLRRFHITFGLTTLTAFLVSGAYLKFVAHPDRLQDGPHLMFLSRHIYILAVALAHLALGAYVAPRPTRAAHVTQWIGSTLLAISGALMIAAFIAEPVASRMRTPVSAYGLYALFAGVVLHAFVGARAP